MSNKKKKISTSKYYPFIISLVVFIVMFGILMLIFYSSGKIGKQKELVYTKIDKTMGNFFKVVPYVNVDISSVNDDIDDFVEEYLKKEKCSIYYDFSNTDDKILSIVIRVIDYDTKQAPRNYFKTINIDLNTSTLLTDKELLNYFKVNDEYVQKKIEKKFADYYWDLVTDNIIDDKLCNLDCFISKRGFRGYMSDLNYYVKDNKLVVYKPFLIATSTEEYNYFKDTDFLLEIK